MIKGFYKHLYWLNLSEIKTENLQYFFWMLFSGSCLQAVRAHLWMWTLPSFSGAFVSHLPLSSGLDRRQDPA